MLFSGSLSLKKPLRRNFPIVGSRLPRVPTDLKLIRLISALSPTLLVMLLAEAVFRYSVSGYSVIVVMLLSVVLYTAYRRGPLWGVVSALFVISYNFYLLSMSLGVPLFSEPTLENGDVIATVFPVLAYIIGTLKSRNDQLLRQEQIARLRAEDSAKQLQFMAESMPQKIFTILPDGTPSYTNPQWKEYNGSGEHAFHEIVHPHDHVENIRNWKHSLKTGEEFQFEHRLRRVDGRYRWHLTRARPLRDANGGVSLWVGSSTDIEDVRKARKLEANTARLIKQRTQLMELNQAKDEFISIASHQLRTPATAVKQYVNMALDGYGGKLTPLVKDFLRKADESNERQLAIINDLLKVAQVDAGKVVLATESCAINRLISSVIRDQRSMLTKRHQTIVFKNKAAKLYVQADVSKLPMVIENLLDNASKYSPEHTTITVETAATKRLVSITISDQGVGIAKQDIPKIFNKFTRLDNPLSTKVGGSGLGLYWVRKIVELHNGTIKVISKPQKGSTFTLRLPIARK